MNKSGTEYCSRQERTFSETCRRLGITPPRFNWSDSKVQERIMRLGREARDFEIEPGNNQEYESVAIATLKEDYVRTAVPLDSRKDADTIGGKEEIAEAHEMSPVPNPSCNCEPHPSNNT